MRPDHATRRGSRLARLLASGNRVSRSDSRYFSAGEGPHATAPFGGRRRREAISGEINRHLRDNGWFIRPARRTKELRLAIAGAAPELASICTRSRPWPTLPITPAHRARCPGIVPSGALHLEAPTPVEDRRVNATEVVFDDVAAEK
ncbi:hypothetical protein GCM10023152_01780 [Agromyces bauzanensis]|uniref:Uncharacterized protein n=1 Tax=Agromyces bauzanensis TaxID=1308924 RepID=A0A917PFR5_9MICO|nr:hypothetical protein GCM10011372_10170 [Agromyces bauzanensis]